MALRPSSGWLQGIFEIQPFAMVLSEAALQKHCVPTVPNHLADAAL